MISQYRALSIDLHDTIVWDTREIVEAQYEVRWNLLGEGLRMPDGSRISPDQLRRARELLASNLKGEGRPVESISVAGQVDRVRRLLGADFAEPVGALVQRFAEGGLKEHPPLLNPEAPALVRRLNELGIPVIVTTDTSRSGSVWKSFLEMAGQMRLTDVVASTDVGACKPDPRIFSEVVHRAGVPASKVLHVGDSWVWDVEGARACGMGAAVYRGLWSRYWDQVPPRPDSRSSDGAVLCFDHLSEAETLFRPA